MGLILQWLVMSSMVFLIAACASNKKFSSSADGDKSDSFVQKSEQLIQNLEQEYKQRLSKAIQEKGLVKALEECHLKNENEVHKVNGDELLVGRTSHKLRNPLNAPEPWMAEYFKDFKSTSASSARNAEALKLPDGRYAYLKPIYVEKQCLSCHGSSLKPEVRAKLNEKYLQDESLGLSEGDFIGFSWVQSNP